jgi:hypothetical protein
MQPKTIKIKTMVVAPLQVTWFLVINLSFFLHTVTKIPEGVVIGLHNFAQIGFQQTNKKSLWEAIFRVFLTFF